MFLYILLVGAVVSAQASMYSMPELKVSLISSINILLAIIELLIW